MWDSIFNNPISVAGISNALMVVIWLTYLQVFLLQFRRQKRPFLVIHHAHGLSPSANCLLVNMSQETVHVQCVIARICTERGEYVRQVADFKRQRGPDEHVEQTLREGPVQPGQYLVLGNFEQIILDDAVKANEGRDSAPEGPKHSEASDADPAEAKEQDTAPEPPSDFGEVTSVELCAAVVHGPSHHPVGARRRFSVASGAEGPLIRPQNIHTEQLTSLRKRRQVRRWVEQCLHPQRRGGWQTQQSAQSHR